MGVVDRHMKVSHVPATGLWIKGMGLATALSGLFFLGCMSPQEGAIHAYCTAESARLNPPVMVNTPQWQDVQVGEKQVGTKRVCIRDVNQTSDKNRESRRTIETCIDRAIMEPVFTKQLVNVPVDTNQLSREASFHACRADALKKGMYQELNEKK
jgi:hypothetical protein